MQIRLSVLSAALLVGLSIQYLPARDLDGRYAQISPSIRKWFQDQRSPKNGGICCNDADGMEAQERIQDGSYWALLPVERFKGINIDGVGRWLPVPDDVVIRDANKAGHPVAWIYFEGGVIKFRCYAPGGGV